MGGLALYLRLVVVFNKCQGGPESHRGGQTNSSCICMVLTSSICGFGLILKPLLLIAATATTVGIA